MKQNLKIYGPPVFYAVMIFIVSSVPSLQLNTGFSYQDKLAHIIEYTVFGFLLQRAFHIDKGRNFRYFICALAIGSVFSVFDEIHQLWIPGREAEIGDFIADIIGVLLGQGLFFLNYRIMVFRR